MRRWPVGLKNLGIVKTCWAGAPGETVSKVGRFEVAMLWLSLLSFCVGFTLTATAAYYGSIFMALMAIFSVAMGALFYGIYRESALSEDVNSSDERRRREAIRETVFLIMFIVAATCFYVAVADVFYNTFNKTEEIVIYVLPTSLGLVGLAGLLYELLKRPPESPPQPEENLEPYDAPPAKRDLDINEERQQ